MIAPVTKEYFYKKVGNPSKWIKRLGFRLDAVLDDEGSRWKSTNVLYFEKLGDSPFLFAYLAEYKVLVIPNIYGKDANLDVDEKEDVFFGDWKMTIMDKIDTRYTKNVFHRSTEYDYDSLDEHFSKALRNCDTRSRICLSNDRIGFKKEVELYKEDRSYSKNLYIGYPEKLKVPLDIHKIYEIDNELKNIILWTQNKQ